MFRAMRRFKQQISDAECVEILKAEEICARLVQKFTDDQEYLEMELKNALPR